MRRQQSTPPGQYVIDFSEDAEASVSAPAHTDSAPTQSAPEKADSRLFYISFGSGSSGNSCYLGTSKGGILIDAGVNDDDVFTALKNNGIPRENIKAILLTHDHTDHIKYVYKILRTGRNIRLYCTNRVLLGILRKHSISKRIKEYHNPIFKEIPFNILDFEITAFEVPHDGSDNVGFSICFAGQRFVLATDLGTIPERAAFYISQANYLVLEANYDLRMLLYGTYPEYLKARIQTERGHMGNEATAAFLAKAPISTLSHIFLCHLSQDNNRPEIALAAIRSALESRGLTVGNNDFSLEDRQAQIHLSALPRLTPSPLFVFRQKL